MLLVGSELVVWEPFHKGLYRGWLVRCTNACLHTHLKACDSSHAWDNWWQLNCQWNRKPEKFPLQNLILLCICRYQNILTRGYRVTNLSNSRDKLNFTQSILLNPWATLLTTRWSRKNQSWISLLLFSLFYTN